MDTHASNYEEKGPDAFSPRHFNQRNRHVMIQAASGPLNMPASTEYAKTLTPTLIS